MVPARTQKLDLILGFKADAISPAGERGDVYGFECMGKAWEPKSAFLTKVIDTLRNIIELPLDDRS